MSNLEELEKLKAAEEAAYQTTHDMIRNRTDKINPEAYYSAVGYKEGLAMAIRIIEEVES